MIMYRPLPAANGPGPFTGYWPMLAVALCCPAATVMAQSTVAEPARFEVASVKPATGTQHGVWYTGDHVRILGLSVHELIAAAYRLKDYQVFGPGWIDSARFDIEAKLPEEAVGLGDSAKSAQIWLMTETLLAERFGMKLHHETRKLAALELGADARGPKFRELGPDPGYNVTVNRGRGQLSADKMSMRQFIEILGYLVDVPLVDKTGITGVFDVKLQWVPESTTADARPAADADVPGGADIRTALRDQLGLKLVSAKLPLEVLVVDSIGKPSDN